MAKQYTVLTGISYRTKRGEKRAVPGDVVTDLKGQGVKWLLANGHIEPVSEETDDGI